MLPSRRDLSQLGLAAAFGLAGPMTIVSPSKAQTDAPPNFGFRRYKVGDVEVTALYDGIWRKPHDAGFIKNASIEDTKEALTKAGQTTDYMPIPLTVIVLKIGGKYIMIDSGSGAQWQPTAGRLPENMVAAGIDPKAISTILISHFHGDHIFGLMERGTNAPIYPQAELVVSSTEYRWWTEAGRVEKLPEARKALGQRIQNVFPNWKNVRLVEDGAEVAPGIKALLAPGHTPGHTAFLLGSGKEQLMISNDLAYVPSLLAPHPDWEGSYDQDSALAVTTRRTFIDRVVADKLLVTGAHFPFPGAGRFEKDGSGYAFTPVSA